MKWSTKNYKAENYNQNHELYVGTQTGTFKKLHVQNETNAFCQKNLQDLSQLDKDSNITTLSYGNDNFEILIGREKKSAQVYSIKTETFVGTVELLAAPIVGLAKYDSFLIGGFACGQIQMLKSPESLIISTGTHMSRLRQCPMEKKLIATGGKDRQNNLKIYNMEVGKQIFTSKNLPNDYLQLEVPVWDTDIQFIDANILTTCSRYGYIRMYDIRKQRRPVQCYANDNQMSFTTVAAHENKIYSGTTMGALKAFDTRHFKNFVHTYKGFTGGVSDLCLDSTGKYIASSSLDRYVRIHCTDSCVLLYQCYVKSKATQILIRESEHKEEKIESVIEEQQNNDKDDFDELFEKMPIISENVEEVEHINKKTKRKSLASNKKIKKKKD